MGGQKGVMMFQQVGRILKLSDMIRARAILATQMYMRRDYPGLVRQLRIIEDLVFALEFALNDEGDGDNA